MKLVIKYEENSVELDPDYVIKGGKTLLIPECTNKKKPITTKCQQTINKDQKKD
jgi:hypothetical protein